MNEEVKVKKPNYKTKYFIFKVLGFIALVLPLLILMIVQKDVYFQTKTRQSVSIAFVLACIVFFLQIKDYTKSWNSAVWLGIFAVIIHFLKPILNDLELILWMALIGQVAFRIINPIALRYKRLALAYEQGIINAETQKANIDSIVEAIKGR